MSICIVPIIRFCVISSPPSIICLPISTPDYLFRRSPIIDDCCQTSRHSNNWAIIVPTGCTTTTTIIRFSHCATAINLFSLVGYLFPIPIILHSSTHQQHQQPSSSSSSLFNILKHFTFSNQSTNSTKNNGRRGTSNIRAKRTNDDNGKFPWFAATIRGQQWEWIKYIYWCRHCHVR